MQQEFEKYLEEYIERGGTAFISSHILSEVQEMAQKITVIREGHIVASGDVDRLLADMPRKAVLRIADDAQVDPHHVAKALDAQLVEVLSDRLELFFSYSVKEFVNRVESVDGIIDFYLPEPSLEDYFLSFYSGDG